MPLDTILKEEIDAMIRAAHTAGRDMLYEHEVYGILRAMGIQVPRHALITSGDDVTRELLHAIGGPKLVMKIVSAAVTHKMSAGGVRMVHADPDFVRYSFDQMTTAFRDMGAPVEGVLISERVEYQPELGNEILLGFRESETFGPVLSFSKGGSDAEFFARHFSPPNLILAPVDRNWATALLESSHIHEKFRAWNREADVGRIVDVGVAFSDLAVAFSSYFDTGTSHVITEFEVNPLVFGTDGRFVAIDGFARFKQRGSLPDLTIAPEETMKPFFEPDGIAVVGVSASDPAKAGNIIVENLIRMERRDIFCVNPRGGSLTVGPRTLPIHTGLEAIDATVELAIITVPADATLPVIEACANKGVKAAILIPGGFAEVDKNRDLEKEIARIAKEGGFRLIGPNCLGIVYEGCQARKGLNTFFIPEDKFSVSMERENKVAILSQSGALGIIEIDNLKNAISPKVIVSYGNQLDVDPCDLVSYFQDDPMINVMGCYIEGFKPHAGRKFFDAVRAGSKPVIVYKAGRTKEGRKATESHTASIAGEYAVAKAAMKQAGAIVADTMVDHGDFIKTFALMNDFVVSGNRVAIIANAGYEKTYAADNLGNLVLADFDEATLAALQAIIPPMAEASPLLDLTPMADDAVFARSIETMLKSPDVDALMVSIVPQSALIHTTDKEIRDNPDNIAARITRLVHAYKKPVAVSVNVVSRADAVYNELGRTLDAGGVPTYLTANRAMVCLNAFINHRLGRDMAHPLSHRLK
ncbi:acetate--CoA ligase family protein [Desulfoluna spongiiphila]|uniref:Acyl-CoA synthetase (NDP forming) n=1 Tax=Desulfoluna spongiiphila TaxID=419481 RepID=A0A1G5GEH3_9BACT|nr:acetate--CoA ligase family protein [Desulfoluna spongiiphila]SCY49737.1 Acyl-CoA synthetase (NDP forming) [Desulfoluna spongiiphila]